MRADDFLELLDCLWTWFFRLVGGVFVAFWILCMVALLVGDHENRTRAAACEQRGGIAVIANCRFHCIRADVIDIPTTDMEGR